MVAGNFMLLWSQVSTPTESLSQGVACLHHLQRGPGNKHTLPACTSWQKISSLQGPTAAHRQGSKQKNAERWPASQPSHSSHILYTCTLTAVKESLAYSLCEFFY
jgi:hypothetical protein